MKCRFCKREIADNSIFCNWCGKEQKKAKGTVSVPKPYQRADGLWTAQMMVNGTRTYVPAQPTEAKYYIEARALKAKLIASADSPLSITLSDACANYIELRRAVLSPSTIYGYERLTKNRFQRYMSKDINSINFQLMVNQESRLCGSKTLKNAWGFVAAVLKSIDFPPPRVVLPQVVVTELPWLDDSQIKIFVEAIKNKPCEAGALLGLHSLRRSEILSMTPSKIRDGFIYVEGSTVRGSDGFVSKKTNKNISSRRIIPVMIPRLLELCSSMPPDAPFITGSGYMFYEEINDICVSCGLPKVGVHGLRRSFASLAWSLGWDEKSCMRYGGWSNPQTMHNIYIKLSAKRSSADVEAMKAFFSSISP